MLKAAFLLIFIATSALAQTNLALKRELDSLYALDQRYRGHIETVGENATLRDSLSRALDVPADRVGITLWEKQSAVDNVNLVRAEQIIRQYGYPGKTLVGQPTNEAVWYIIQHSEKIDQYLPLVKRAADAQELPFRLYAMMLDRHLMNHRLPQIYGTQSSCFRLRNADAFECFVWPVKDWKKVNSLRQKAGFTTTVEQNARRLNNALVRPHWRVADVRQRYRVDN